MASAMPADCTLITVEIDENLASVARDVLGGDHRVRVITGDAGSVLPGLAPFDLIFADAGSETSPDLVDMLRLGGRVVNDDVTPQAALPQDSPFLTDDPKRRMFFGDDRLVSAEVVLPDLKNSLLVGTRVG